MASNATAKEDRPSSLNDSTDAYSSTPMETKDDENMTHFVQVIESDVGNIHDEDEDDESYSSRSSDATDTIDNVSPSRLKSSYPNSTEDNTLMANDDPQQQPKGMFGNAFAKRFPSKFSLQKIRGDLKKAANDVIQQAQQNGLRNVRSPRANGSKFDSLGVEAFRGRYTNDGDSSKGRSRGEGSGKVASPIHSPNSQVTKILQSRAGDHVEKVIRSVLKTKDEYMILLGPGPLGCYLKNIMRKPLPPSSMSSAKLGQAMGVYVDYLIPGKAAEKSGLVDIGDRIIKVGEVDVTHETIDTVPQTIAKASRPLVVVLSRAHVPSNPPSAIDTVIEVVFRVQDEAAEAANESCVSSMPLVNPINDENLSISSSDDGSAPELGEGTTPQSLERNSHLHGFQRRSDRRSFTALSRAVAASEEFRIKLKDAFQECCLDPRRLPFITAYVAKEEVASPSESIKLMFWLEVQSFKELYTATPTDERRRTHVKRIFEKFLASENDELRGIEELERKLFSTSLGDDTNSNTLSPDMFSLRTVFSQNLGCVKKVEELINDEESPIAIDILDMCQQFIENDLCGARFASFLDSDEGARMRAHLMATNAYINLSCVDIFEACVKGEPYAITYIHLMLVHLVGEGVSGGLAAALYIRRTLIPLFHACHDKTESSSDQISWQTALKHFWDLFLSPNFGALDKLFHSPYCEKAIDEARSLYSTLFSSKPQNIKEIDVGLKEVLMKVADELLFDYALNFYPKFKQHAIYSTLCDSIVTSSDGGKGLRKLSDGCVSRVLRRFGLPSGVSMHRPMKSPAHDKISTGKDINCDTATEFAVVFGTDDESAHSFDHVNGSSVSTDMPSVQRFVSVNINEISSLLKDVGIPDTLEKYVSVPPKRRSPFCLKEKSVDGWEVSLVDIDIPHTSPQCPGGHIYGVSLVLQRNTYISHYRDLSLCLDEAPVTESNRVRGDLKLPNSMQFLSKEMSNSTKSRFSSNFSFNGDVVGIAFLSSHNVIPLMRHALSDLVKDIIDSNKNDYGSYYLDLLVDILGIFKRKDIDPGSLSTIAKHYLNKSAKSLDDSSIAYQELCCEKRWNEMLFEALSPVAMSLAFGAILLEQKIVFYSSRRSLLVACIKSLISFLKPLEWSHLLVPTLPNDMIGDILQYPGPFIVGIVSDNPDGNEWINELPSDVSLVDLDIGRAILADNISSNDDDGIRVHAIRTQLLYLSEELGRYIGIRVYPNEWECDQVLTNSNRPEAEARESRHVFIRQIYADFVHELLEGIQSCCLWVDELEPIVIFEEDRFFHVKNLRAQKKSSRSGSGISKSNLSLSIDEFDVLLEAILRCQGISTYISSQKKESMLFW